ncbi:PAS domain-containing sensor histidine kinase [Geothermobacter hydrogeniphilus]|uniref:histidine kinase n=1 Tax=Geothermobacter hydrogeniphilus TaxID=1969733 RepID=A0A1X0Y0K5_9BACT|nr:PAS domain-containing sensor histidine kinase [Geothermobacter hydrogeniphilus]ORJ58715.1 hypothetical protein B5V00_11475 [Geothermobacter hydrogeniphilus]
MLPTRVKDIPLQPDKETMKQAPLTDFLKLLPVELLLRTMPSGLFLVDTDQRVVYWNSEAERITGYSAEEALGRHCSFLEGVECGRGCGLYSPTVEKPVIGAICTIYTKAGDSLIISKNIDYLRKDGEIVGGIESFIDVTEQKKLEAALRRQSEQLESTVAQRTAELEKERSRLNSLLEAMTDFAYIVTDDYQLSYMNRAMIEQLGDHVGECCFNSLHDLNHPCPDCPIERVGAGEIVREERFIPKLKQTHELLHTPLASSDGKTLKLAVCRDITERKAVEQALRDANTELDAFAHTVSHDLRSPLTPIIGFAEYLREQYRDKLDEQALGLLRDIETQGHKMLQQMEDLLVLAQIGKLPQPAEPLSTNAVVADVMENLRDEIADKQAEISVGLLPAARLPETLLIQMFSNLLGNALRYGCEPGGKVEISGEREGRRLRYQVRDHGRGLEEKERERIFEPFTRGRSSTGEGTGIGLAIVAKLARIYNGRARVEETPGGGCTFVVDMLEPE